LGRARGFVATIKAIETRFPEATGLARTMMQSAVDQKRILTGPTDLVTSEVFLCSTTWQMVQPFCDMYVDIDFYCESCDEADALPAALSGTALVVESGGVRLVRADAGAPDVFIRADNLTLRRDIHACADGLPWQEVHVPMEDWPRTEFLQGPFSLMDTDTRRRKRSDALLSAEATALA